MYKTAKNARLISAIKLYELAYIMAMDEIYNDLLPELWERSGLDDGRFPLWEPSMIKRTHIGKPDVSPQHVRTTIWYWLLSRWTIYEKFERGPNDYVKSFYFGNLKHFVKRLFLYEKIDADGEFRKIAINEKQTSRQYIKLDEFGEYLKKIVPKYFKKPISIPLPKLLFPESKETIKPNEQRQDTVSNFIKENDTVIKKHDNVFWRSGDNWLIKYNGKSVTIQNLKGLYYIAYLLGEQGNHISSYDLSTSVKGVGVPEEDDEISESYKKMSEEQLDEQGFSSRLSDLEFEDLSDKDKEELETTATNVWDDLIKAKEEDNREIIERKQEEWKKLKNYFFSEYGVKVWNTPKGILYNYMKKPTIETDRIRTNVKNSLKYAIEKIRDKIPSLAAHFDGYLHTGTKCCYSPDPDLHIEWYIHKEN